MAKIYGHELTCYFNPETTFDTVVTPAAGDALRVTSATFGAPKGRETPNDRRGTRSMMERTASRDPEQPWALEGIVRPSGALGTAPDFGDLMKHAFGTETVVASTSVAYTLLKDPSALSATIMRIQNNLLEGVSGAIVQNFGFSWSGEEYIRWTADGVAASYIEAGKTLANGAGSATTALVVDDGSFYTVGGIIKIGTDDNSGAGHRITAVSGQNITIADNATWSDNDEVVPFLPAGTFAGDPLWGLDGQVSLDNGSSTITTEGGSFTLATGLGLINSSFGQTKPEAVSLETKRSVNFDLNFLTDDTTTYLMQDFRDKTSYDVQIILGDTAAKRIKINMNTSELDPEQRDSPEEGIVNWSVAGIALGSSGEDEVDLMLD